MHHREGWSIEPFDGSGSEWDAMIGRFENATFSHLYGWRSVIEDALGHEALFWVARNDHGAIEAVMPMARVRSILFGEYLVSMPFLSYGGPVGSREGQATLVSAAQEEAKRSGVDLIEIRARHEITAPSLTRNPRKITVVKKLPGSTEELWADGIRSKVRSQIRRPMKEGMEARFGPELLDPFYAVFARTMRDLGTPVLPKPFFESVRDNLRDHVVFAIIELDGEPLAAGCALHWNRELEISWAGSSREHSRLAPNMLLYWRMMEHSIELGMHTFNFGRCTPDSGTHRFKQQWGTEDQPLPWLQWSPKGVTSTPNPEAMKFRVATRVWQTLPLSLANRLGPHLSKSIP